MKNHGLGTHNDKMCAEIPTGNTPNTPQLNQLIRQNRPIIRNFLEKCPHHMSIVHGEYHSKIIMCTSMHFKAIKLFVYGIHNICHS